MRDDDALPLRLAVVAWILCGLAIIVVIAGLARGAEPVPISRNGAKIELGRAMFYERALSVDFSTSCGVCHQPERAYTQGDRLAVGMVGNTVRPEGFVGTRNTPTVLNAFNKKRQFADGRAASISDQALMPWTNPQEMGLPSIQAGLNRLAAVDGGKKYFPLFGLAYGEQVITAERAADALAMFEATLVVRDSPIQRFMDGEESALTERQKRGLVVFERRSAATATTAGICGSRNSRITGRRSGPRGISAGSVSRIIRPIAGNSRCRRCCMSGTRLPIFRMGRSCGWPTW